jgi:ethanolamine ammonia-lyase small subunit
MERVASLAAAKGARRSQVQIVISDGLNAHAVNENLRAVLPPLRRELAAAGLHVGDVDVVTQNGRVRAGNHVGALVDADAVVHFIAERPGTGLDTLSVYLTYGRDRAGRSRWRVTEAMDRVCATIGDQTDTFVGAAARRVVERSEW